MPLVAPLTLPAGELAAEVDCYVNVDPYGSTVVYAHVAIQPESPQAVEHLRNQDLCTVSGQSADSPWIRRFTIAEARGWGLRQVAL